MTAEEIFLAAVEKATPAELAAFVDGACTGNAKLRAEVERLLKSHEQAGSFLNQPLFEPSPTVDQPSPVERPGMHIGPYKLLQQIGEGGMGTVYMAEQMHPVQRKVALKIIKPGMDSRQVLARFEAERQALALMDHPNIARVLDAGTTEVGRPYFVMELVKGIPITQYCDEHQLTPRQRLELFLHVCHAVQHAHHKGIIHRDLKPSNVLVAEYDQDVVPKIIDFGVAKAIGQRLTEKTMFTEFGQVVGTIEYMSPEQAKLNQLDIDTRTDIYSLGVLLYELLTGDTPLDRQKLRSAAFDEMLRIIREEEPPKPSMRLSTSVTLASVAACRHTEPKKLTMLMRGELDWIVMKALEKDRNRRYETANGLGMDIQRYLNDEHVLACPPSAGYRLRKFARRNKAALATAALVLAASVVGTGISTWQAIRATNAEALAHTRLNAEQQARRDAEIARDGEAKQRRLADAQRELAERNAAEREAQRQRAEANFAKARAAVDEYLAQVTENELLTVPGLQPLREDLLQAALTFYAEFTQERADDPTLARELASAHFRLGRIQSDLGNGQAARDANQEAIRLYEQQRNAGNAGVDVQVGLARAYFHAGRNDDTVQLCRQVLQAEPTHTEASGLLADTYNQLAVADKNKDDVAAALKYHQQAFELREALVRDFPEDPRYLAELGGTVNNLGVLLGKQGQREEALAMYERAVEYSTQAYERAPHSILWSRWLCQGLRNVAITHAALEHEEEALRFFERQVAASRKRAFENPAVAALRGDLYKAYLDLGRYQQRLGSGANANRSFRDAREVLEQIPRETPDQLYELATVYAALAQPVEGSLPSIEEDDAERQHNLDLAMQTLHKAVEGGYANVQVIKGNRLFDAMRQRADFQQLVATLDKAVQAQELASSKEGSAAAKLANRRQAAQLLSDLAQQPGAARHRGTLAATLQSMGEIQTGLKQFAEAEKSLVDAIALWRDLAEQQPEKPQLQVDRIASQISLGSLYRESGRGAEAHRTWQSCLAELEQLRSQHAKDAALGDKIAQREYYICGIYGRLGAFSQAAAYLRRNLQLARIYRPVLDLDAGIVLATLQGDDALREVCRLIDRDRTKAGGRAWLDTELRNLGKVSNLLNPPALPAEQSLAWIEKTARADPNSWHLYLLALAQHRAGKSAEGLATMEKVTAPGSAYDYDARTGAGGRLNACFTGVLIAHGAGKEDLARERLQKSEALFVQYCRETLEASATGLAPPLSASGHWWEFTAPVVLRREAWRLVGNGAVPDDAWLRLIEARAAHLLGDAAKRDEQLAGADSRNIEVWLARARLAEQWGESERAAEAHWQKIVELAGDNPRPWIQRGRWYAERGEHEKANADFAKAASLTPDELNKFLEAGWWVVGPYPEPSKEFCPPEVAPDPSQPVYTIDPKTGLSELPVAWRSVPTGESGRVDLRAAFNADHFSAYALNFIYSPEERSTTLWVGGDDHLRVWLNGRLVQEASPAGITRTTEDRVPVKLRAGRNVLLAKVSQNYGPNFLSLRVGDGTLDRAFALAELGLWGDAVQKLRQADPQSARDAWLAVRFAQMFLAAGDVEGYRRHREWILQQFGKPASSFEASHVAWALTLAPDVAPDGDRLVRIAEQGLDPKQRYHTGFLARALYRAGRFDEAIGRLGEIADLRNPVNDLLLAMAHHGRGDKVKAGELLDKAQTWYEEATRTALAAPKYDLPHWHWNEFADFQIFYHEARALIEGTAVVEDNNAAELLARAREELAQRDRLTAEFDRAVMCEPAVARHWLARGWRLAELGRWDEAKADFKKAVELKPDDVEVRLAEARFYAESAELARAQSTFAAILELPTVKNSSNMSLLVEREIGLQGEVLDEWQKLDPKRAQLWRIRAERQMRLGQWQAALQSLSSGDPHYSHESYCALLCSLLGDQSGHQRARLREVELADVRPDATRHFGHLRSLAMWPGSDYAQELKRQLAAHPEHVPNALWRTEVVGLVHYRLAEYQLALEQLQPLRNPSSEWQSQVSAWPLLAMTHWQLGQQAEARKWLARSEWWIDWIQRGTEAPHSVGVNSVPFFEFLQAHVFYREAKALIDGPESARQAFELLAKTAHQKQQGAQARADALRKDALARAEAAWQRAVELAGDNPRPLIQRGRWYAERGEHEKADADFAKAASLTPNDLNKFLEAGWWVVGPYPAELKEFCPPEVDPDPSKPVYVIDPKTGLSNEPVRWQNVATGESAVGVQDGRVDLTTFPGRTGGGSVYALGYVFSPDERSVTLHLDKNLPCRLWVNGASTEPASADAVGWLAWTRVPVVLRPGRNTILMKTASQRFMALLSDAPAAHAWELFKFGDFDRAVKAYAKVLQNPVQNPAHQWIVRHACFAALVTGDQAAYREYSKRLASHSNPALDGEKGIHDAEVYASTDVPEADLPRLRSILERWYDNPKRKREPWFERMAAWSHYRLGEFDKVVAILRDHPDETRMPPVLAMAYHRLGQQDLARQWLAKADAVVDQHLNDFAGNGQEGLWLIYPTYREAVVLIRGDAIDLDIRFDEFLAERRRLWDARDPLVCAFDDAISNAPKDPHAWLARARRLAELGRFDEAEADFNKAVELKPNDPDVLAARATFFADRGAPDKAAGDFHAALNLLRDAGDAAKPRSSSDVSIDLEIAQREDVFERLMGLRPSDGQLRRTRLILRDLEGDRDGAQADARDLAPRGNHYELAAHALWWGDRQEFERIRAMDIRGWQPKTQVWLLGLAPTEEPMTTQILEAAERMWREGPQTSWERRLLGLAQLRSGRFVEAAASLEATLAPSNGVYGWEVDALTWPLLAIACHQLGDADRTRRWLDKTEVWLNLRQAADAHAVTRGMGHGMLPPHYFRACLSYLEAKALIDGPDAATQARDQLVARRRQRSEAAGAKADRVRKDALAKYEAALKHAVELAGDNPAPWIKRGRFYAEQGQLEKAVADWQRAVELAGSDPLPWIQRGRWYAERGEQEKADADFAKAATLTPNRLDRFLEAGWWVIGPYPPNLKEFCPPEVDPDPSKPVYTIDPKTGLSEERTSWGFVATGRDGMLDLPGMATTQIGGSVYVLAQVYSPDERTELIRVGEANGIRVWCNAHLVLQTEERLGERRRALRIPVTLRRGRNHILIRTRTDRPLTVNLGDGPIAQVLTLAEQGLWQRAAEATFANDGNVFANEILANDVRAYCSSLWMTSLVGDERVLNHEKDRLLRLATDSTDFWRQVHAALTLVLTDDPRVSQHAGEIMVGLRKHISSFKQDDAKKDYGLRALSLYAALQGDIAPAQDYLQQHWGGTSKKLAPLRAMIELQHGQPDRAAAELKVALEYWEQESSLWYQRVWYLALLRKAERHITATTERTDGIVAKIAKKAATLAENRHPQTAAYDCLVDTYGTISSEKSPTYPYLMRARRLAELGRFDEAEADFKKAVELEPAAVEPLFARARFHAQRGDLTRARTDFDAALKLARAGKSGIPVGAVERELGLHDAVLAAWQELDPDVAILWRIRAERQLLLRNWKEAAELFSQGNPHWYHEEFRAALCCLFDDAAGYHRACQRHAELSETIADARDRNHRRLFLLSLRPIAAEQATEFERLLEEALKFPPSEKGLSYRSAIALYRQGRHNEALALLDEVFAGGGWQYQAKAWPLRALIHWKLGHSEEARKWLAHSEWWLDLSDRAAKAPQSPGPPDAPYQWLAAQLFTREAKELIEAPQPKP